VGEVELVEARRLRTEGHGVEHDEDGIGRPPEGEVPEDLHDSVAARHVAVVEAGVRRLLGGAAGKGKEEQRGDDGADESSAHGCPLSPGRVPAGLVPVPIPTASAGLAGDARYSRAAGIARPDWWRIRRTTRPSSSRSNTTRASTTRRKNSVSDDAKRRTRG